MVLQCQRPHLPAGRVCTALRFFVCMHTQQTHCLQGHKAALQRRCLCDWGDTAFAMGYYIKLAAPSLGAVQPLIHVSLRVVHEQNNEQRLLTNIHHFHSLYVCRLAVGVLGNLIGTAANALAWWCLTTGSVLAHQHLLLNTAGGLLPSVDSVPFK